VPIDGNSASAAAGRVTSPSHCGSSHAANRRCGRGEASGGKACSHRIDADSGNPYCTKHRCPHPGCSKSKSSSETTCSQHSASGATSAVATSFAVEGYVEIIRCARGEASGGRACSHHVLPGMQYCTKHSCSHQGCFASKSSSDHWCPRHNVEAVPPPRQGIADPVPTGMEGNGGDVSSGSGGSGAKVAVSRGGSARASGQYGFDEAGGSSMTHSDGRLAFVRGKSNGASICNGFEDVEEV